jgi:large subunit ribosomal protein L29
MKPKELRDLTDEELAGELDDQQKALFNLRWRKVTERVAGLAELHNVRKEIARIKTIMAERERAGAPEGEATPDKT